VGSDQKVRVKGLWKDVIGMMERGTRLPSEVADVLQVINDSRDGASALLSAYRASRVSGSELTFDLEDASKFLRDFAGLKGQDCARWLTREVPAGNHWAICGNLTSKQILALVTKVPHWRWTPENLRAIDVDFDARQPAEQILWTPAGLEATQACPKFVGVSYRWLWEVKEQVVTCREAVILLLQIYWKHKVWLDPVGWTCTGSRRVDGGGVYVDGYDGELDVRWNNPGNAYPSGSSRSVVLG